MGPSCRRSTRKSSTRRTLLKKKSQNSKKIQEISSPAKPASSTDPSEIKCGPIDCDKTSVCSTPKAEKYRIPEISTCPPAPKKRRIVTSCSLRRGPIAFFDPPDIELFFYLALRGISA